MSPTLYCRTCLSNEHLSPIFSDEKTSECRSNELFLVTGVSIKLNDKLSQSMCESCNKIVNESLKLRSQSQATEKLLKNMKNSDDCIKTKTKKTEMQKQINAIQQIENLETKVIESDQTKQEYINKTNNLKRNNEKTIDNNCLNNRKKTLRTRKRNHIHLNNKDISDYKKSRMISKAKRKYYDKEHEDYSDDNINSNDSTIIKIVDSYVNEKECNGNNAEEKEIKHKRKRLTKAEAQRYMSLAIQPVPGPGPVLCSLCGAQLRERRFFISHAKTHFEGEHGCECGKRFRSGITLRYHQQRVHGAIRRLACSLCPFRAVDRGTLQNHSRAVHTGERPYTCDVCGDSFRVRATIVQHMRTHFATYDVQCEKCPALFRSRSELASHRNRVHLMSYTYFCYLCPGSYKAVGTVKNHIVKVHGIPRDQHPPIKCSKTRRPSIADGGKIT